MATQRTQRASQSPLHGIRATPGPAPIRLSAPGLLSPRHRMDSNQTPGGRGPAPQRLSSGPLRSCLPLVTSHFFKTTQASPLRGRFLSLDQTGFHPRCSQSSDWQPACGSLQLLTPPLHVLRSPLPEGTEPRGTPASQSRGPAVLTPRNPQAGAGPTAPARLGGWAGQCPRGRPAQQRLLRSRTALTAWHSHYISLLRLL